MELLTIDSWKELKNKMPILEENSFLAVEGLIFDRDNKWILHRRGPECRDEQYKLEGIGGRVDKGEGFRHALMREIAEEVGTKAVIQPLGIYDIRNDTVYDNRLKKKLLG